MANMRLGPNVNPAIYINIGFGMDYPCGHFITGNRGETIVNGGLGRIILICGSGNNYKSTLVVGFTGVAFARVSSTEETYMTSYDTEINVSIQRYEDLTRSIEYMPESPILSMDKPVWFVTNKSDTPGNVWAERLIEYSKNRKKEVKVKWTALKDPYTGEVHRALVPSFATIDSMSEMEAQSTVNQLSGDLDDKKNKTSELLRGLFKSKLISQLPAVSYEANMTIAVTAHVGEKINMATGPAKYATPDKQLQHLRNGVVLKGLTGKGNYLVNGGAYHVNTATKLNNERTKTPEYPKTRDCIDDVELNVVRLSQIRNKNGTSGYCIYVVISQYDGLLPECTDLLNLRKLKYGLNVSGSNFTLDLLPDLTFNRLEFRELVKEDNHLTKALSITYELYQIKRFHNHGPLRHLLCTPKELYEDLISMGYDMDMLYRTRSWMAISNYSSKLLPYLSTVDLLKMRAGLYIPYWFKKKDKDKITKGNKK